MKINGKKTYIVAGAMIVYAVLGVALHKIGFSEAVDVALQAAALAGLRHAVSQNQSSS